MEVLREVADGTVTPEEGVRVYRDALHGAGVSAHRSLEEDMLIYTPALRE